MSERRKLLSVARRMREIYGWHQLVPPLHEWYWNHWGAASVGLSARSVTAVVGAASDAESAAYAWSDGPGSGGTSHPGTGR